MRFFKKLFSIGSKRPKNRSAMDPCAESLPPVQEHLHLDDTEAAVSRLLRSSSGRLAAEPRTGLGSLPPLPHPVDSVIPPPKSSFTTLASVSARSTYSVTIHSRTVHSRTEFPNAYPPMDVSFTSKRSFTNSPRRRSKSVPITPRDKSRILALRQDPSVASLLNYYDDEGHLSSTLFSNTPQNEGRVQRRRTGSTLQQLLGHSSSSGARNSGTEGDISWAEKFLGETDANSSVSSIGPRTPADTHFTHSLSTNNETTLPIEYDTSTANHPTFSSLEVELSVSTDVTSPQVLDSLCENPMSSQHASQIFGFLDDKKRTHDGLVSRLPQLKTTGPHHRHFSGESSISDTTHSHILLPHYGSTHIPQPVSPTSQRRYSITSDGSRSLPPSLTAAVFLSTQCETQESTHLQPTVTQHTEQGIRELRGPHPPSKIPSQQCIGCPSAPGEANGSHPMTEQSLQSVFGEKSNIDNKHVIVTVARPRETHSQIPKLRSASGSSSSSAKSKYESAVGSPRRQPAPLQSTQLKPSLTEAGLSTHGKENDVLSRLPQPVTPVRPFGFRSHLLEPPSPASSSELSPVTQQMMANLRQQRLHARQRERQAGRLGSGHSRIRY